MLPLERVKRKTFDYWTQAGLSPGRTQKKRPELKQKHLRLSFVAACQWAQQAGAGTEWLAVTPGACPSSWETLTWLWTVPAEAGAGLGAGCQWGGCQKMVSRNVTGRVQAVAVPFAKGWVESAWVFYGLRLPSDWLTSSGCEPQRCRGGWSPTGTHLPLWQ